MPSPLAERFFTKRERSKQRGAGSFICPCAVRGLRYLRFLFVKNALPLGGKIFYKEGTKPTKGGWELHLPVLGPSPSLPSFPLCEKCPPPWRKDFLQRGNEANKGGLGASSARARSEPFVTFVSSL